MRVGNSVIQSSPSWLYCFQKRDLPHQCRHPAFTCLKISKYNAERDVLGIIALLKCLPNLETLIVNVERSYYSDRDVIINVSDIKIPLPYLKTVEFHGFRSLGEVDKNTLKLISLLLENAEHLERIVIYVGGLQMVVGPHAALHGISKTAKI